MTNEEEKVKKFNLIEKVVDQFLDGAITEDEIANRVVIIVKGSAESI